MAAAGPTRDGEGRPESPFVWVRPRWYRREYELRAGEAVIGTLRWESGWRSSAVAAMGGMGGARWRFARQGFWRARVSATDEASGMAAASFEFGWNGGGTMFLPDGQTYLLRRTGFWRLTWEWRRGDDTSVMRFRRVSWTGREVRVELADAALADANAALLMAFGWYLILLAQAAAASAAAAGSV